MSALASQPPLWGNIFYRPKADVSQVVEIAHAAGLAAACCEQVDQRRGKVKISLKVEFDEITLPLIQNLCADGWEHTSEGAEWVIALPTELFDQSAIAPALAYANAFKTSLRRGIREPLRFTINTKYTDC